jgi:hypothetical protein
MSKTVLVLFAACVGLSLLSLHLVKQMRAGQATITELQAQVAKFESERQRNPPASGEVVTSPPVATWHVEPIAPAPANKEAPKAVASRPAMPAPAEGMFSPSREDRTRMIREARERQRQLMQDPDYREAVRVQHRSNIARQYPGLSQELGLTAEQTEQLFDLLVDQQLRNNEQAEVIWDTEGADPATAQQRQQKMQQQWAEIQQKNEAELAAQLGPGKAQAWKEYQSTLVARHQAEQLRTTLSGRGVPLSEDASRAIVKAYAEAQKAEMQEYANMAKTNVAAGKQGAVTMLSHSAPTAEMYERQIENAKKRNERVLEALTPFLTYEQREALQKEQEAELKMQEAQMRIMRAQSEVQGNNNGGWVSNSAQAIIIPNQ